MSPLTNSVPDLAGMIKSILLLAALAGILLAEGPKPLGEDCFACRCIRNIDYQVGQSWLFILPRNHFLSPRGEAYPLKIKI